MINNKSNAITLMYAYCTR